MEDSSGGEYAAIQAAGTTTTYTITLPAAVGTSGQVLTLSDGAGATSWSDAGTTSTIANGDNRSKFSLKWLLECPGNLISYDDGQTILWQLEQALRDKF